MQPEAVSPELVLVAPPRLRDEAILELPMFELWQPAPTPPTPLRALVTPALVYFGVRLFATMATMAAISIAAIVAIVAIALLA